MTGKIYFMELEELAEFLAAFCETRSTAVFEVKQWEKIGILKSNESEFPDDGSRKSLERKEAFEFARNAALNLE